MKVFSPGQIASSKDVNDNFAELQRNITAMQTNRPHIITVPVDKNIGNINYTNQTFTYSAFRNTPIVLFANSSDNSLIVCRTINATKNTVAVQFQTANGSHLGRVRGTLILIGDK